MFTDTVLNPTQKKIAFKALKKIPKETLHPYVIRAAFENLMFPTTIETEQLTSLKTTYKTCSSLPVVGALIEQSIIEYFKYVGYEELNKLFDTKFTGDHWPSGFLIHLINALNINIENNPLVILTIKEGKVYWKYVCGERVLHDRTARKDPDHAFNFDDTKTISMTWEQFREFKDAGKRGGTVAITKERFALEFNRSQRTVADTIWANLKELGVLDDNNRLSHAWRCTTGEVLLPCIEERVAAIGKARTATKVKEETAYYKQTITALNSISENRQYAETISLLHPVTIFRPDRSPKIWASTGRVTTDAGKSKPYQVKPWDISTYSDLNSHAESNDSLDHDHIPSTSFLNDRKKQLLAVQGRASNDDKTDWGCIAISHDLHKQGVSHSESSTSQTKRINKPFFDEVSDYLNKLEMNWQHTLLIDNEYLKALGALRYLYRCNTTRKMGTVPYGFFNENSALREEIDQLFMDRLERFTIKKEGKLSHVTNAHGDEPSP